MKTQGEIEAAVCQGIASFKQQHLGRGPKDIQAHLLGDLLVIRLHGVLTPAEQQLIKTHQPDKGKDLVKQIRVELMEGARPVLDQLVQDATGVNVVSLHFDISTTDGEEVIVFTLVEAPKCRGKKC